MKRGKNYLDSVKLYDKATQYDVEQAVELCLQTAKAKFDETIELSVRLGVDPRHADQQVRGAVVLPHGTGKKVRVLCEEAGKKEGIICGRTTYNTIVEFEGPPALISQFAQVQITGATNWVLSGKLL